MFNLFRELFAEIHKETSEIISYSRTQTIYTCSVDVKYLDTVIEGH